MSPKAVVAAAWMPLAFLALAALPFVPDTQASLYAQQLTPIFVYALLALGLNVVTGYTGLLHLGIAAYFGVGAYAFGILTVPMFPFQQSFVVAAAAAVVAAAAVGVATTAPTLRLRGDYLALVTMGFGLIIGFVIRNLGEITEGTRGLNPIAPPLLPLVPDADLGGARLGPGWGARWYDYPYLYLACLGLLAAVMVLLRNLENSRTGRSWVALREDELAAGCMGLNPAKLKLTAIALGAGLAGLAGALFALSQRTTAGPQAYDFNRSMITLCCVILGGLGNRPGVILGVFLLIGYDMVLTPILDSAVQKPDVQNLFPEWMRGKQYLKVSGWRLFIFGAALILMMRFRPAGLLPASRTTHELNPTAGARE